MDVEIAIDHLVGVSFEAFPQKIRSGHSDTGSQLSQAHVDRLDGVGKAASPNLRRYAYLEDKRCTVPGVHVINSLRLERSSFMRKRTSWTASSLARTFS